MGAMPYQNLAPWSDDPARALVTLQAEFLSENYDIPGMLQEQLESSRQAVRSCQEDGDEYGLLDGYQAEVDYLESVIAKPLPESPEAQVQLVRRVWESSGQGVGNILDLKDANHTGGLFVARWMKPEELQQHLGTAEPSETEAPRLIGFIGDEIGRGEGVCFPVYASGQPFGWWFAGYTID